MKRIPKAAKLVAINLSIFLVMIWSVNLLISVGIDVKYLFKQWFPSISEKAERASLEDQELARDIDRDFALLRTRYEPTVAWSRESFQGKTTTVNEAGDRVHTGASKDPVGHIRFFGGSTMWGTGVDDENTIPAQFNALHPGYRVHNHGESGFVSRQEVARLINLVNQDEPMDLVVFYDGCNEANTICRADISINGHRSEVKIAEKMQRGSATVEDLIGSVRRLAKGIVGGVRPASRCQEEPEHARRVAATLLNDWRIAKRVAELGGAEFHAILQPNALIGSPNLDYLPKKKARKERETSDAEIIYRYVREMTRDEPPEWLHDFTDVFDVDEYIYIDSCHVNSLGNELVARKLDQLIGASLVPKAR